MEKNKTGYCFKNPVTWVNHSKINYNQHKENYIMRLLLILSKECIFYKQDRQ